MKKETARLVGEIAALAHEQNAPDYTVFVGYYGHTRPESVSVDVHENGWVAEKNPDHKLFCVDVETKELADVLLWMKRIHAEFRASNPAHQRAETVQKLVGAAK